MVIIFCNTCCAGIARGGEIIYHGCLFICDCKGTTKNPNTQIMLAYICYLQDFAK